jgi:hypothetical protein
MEVLWLILCAVLFGLWRVFVRFPSAALGWLDLLERWEARQERKRRREAPETLAERDCACSLPPAQRER